MGFKISFAVADPYISLANFIIPSIPELIEEGTIICCQEETTTGVKHIHGYLEGT
ncbi:MAG: hypothetical protein ACFFBZ_11620 [Promethearchaeota archaeon]